MFAEKRNIKILEQWGLGNSPWKWRCGTSTVLEQDTDEEHTIWRVASVEGNTSHLTRQLQSELHSLGFSDQMPEKNTGSAVQVRQRDQGSRAEGHHRNHWFRGCRKSSLFPHQEIIQADKQTTKLCIVYDASAKKDGPSLNDCLYAGPLLSPLLMDSMMWFRCFKVALVGDIEKAFLRMGVSVPVAFSSYRCVTVFVMLWCHHSESAVKRAQRIPRGKTCRRCFKF